MTDKQFNGFIRVFPAGAGVILHITYSLVLDYCFPRRCGGDPGRRWEDEEAVEFSPQVRG